MNYEIGTARSLEIEWQYGLAALTGMIGISLPRYFRLQVIEGHADWSPQFQTGRVLQLARSIHMDDRSNFDDVGDNPRYIEASISILDSWWTREHGTIRIEAIGHPAVLNRRDQVVQNEVFVDRQIRLVLVNGDLPEQRLELMPRWAEYHVSEKTALEVTPWSFEVDRETRGNVAAMQFAQAMHEAGYRSATLTELLWYAAKYQDEIPEDQPLVPWAGYSGGFSEGRQLRHHLGLSFVWRHKGVLKLAVHEFLGQWMPVSHGVQYLSVKL